MGKLENNYVTTFIVCVNDDSESDYSSSALISFREIKKNISFFFFFFLFIYSFIYLFFAVILSSMLTLKTSPKKGLPYEQKTYMGSVVSTRLLVYTVIELNC